MADNSKNPAKIEALSGPRRPQRVLLFVNETRGWAHEAGRAKIFRKSRRLHQGARENLKDMGSDWRTKPI